jgi:hypothetical protein
MGEIGRAPNSKTLFVNTDPIIRNSIMQAHESQDAKEPAASIKGISI